MQASVLLSIGNHVEADLYCSILYQRGVYPSEDFEQQKQYGLTMMVSTEPGIRKRNFSFGLFVDVYSELCSL